MSRRFVIPCSLVFVLSASVGRAALASDAAIPAFDGNGRAYLATTKRDYANSHFQAEVTVTVASGHGGSGCAFYGLGRGQADSNRYDEPSSAPSIYLRLAPSDFAGGVTSTSVNDTETANPSAIIGDGTHRVRLLWNAVSKRAAFGIDRNWDGISFHADATVTLSAAGLDFGDEARLFVGGASGVKFADFTTRPATAADLAAMPVVIVNDPTAGTWLPTDRQPVHGDSGVEALLKPLSGTLRPLACWYDGSKLVASRPFVNGRLSALNTTWSCSITSDKSDLSDPSGSGWDLNLVFKLESGSAASAGVAAAFDFSDWNTNNYVLLPASVYNGNRNRIVGRGYNAGLDRKELYNKDLQLTHGDVPCLALDPAGRSKLEVSACNTATPAICFYNRETKRGFILLAEQGIRNERGEITDNAFCVEESADRTRATLVVSAPGVRERKPEFIGFGASPDRGRNLKPGDTITLRLRLHAFDAADLPAFLDKFMAVRKALTGPNQPRNLIPQSQTTEWMTARIDSRFHDGANKFYCPENAPWISYGWIGGMMNTFPMLALGDPTHLERATQTLDFGIRGQGKSGYYYGCIDANGKTFGREAYDDHQELVLTRKNADVLFWMIKQFELLKAQGKAAAIKPAWEESMKRLAEAFVTTWNRDGQWGNYLNVEDGRVAIYNTTGGIMACGGLALAAKYYHEPRFLKTAEEAAKLYYQRDFVKLGFTTGACADIMQNADSETATGLMTALMALYETTGETQWLEMSRNAANLVSTWTTSYDYELPKSTELGRLGAKLAGIYWASTQNKHGAPGICTSSGDPLFKIYRAAGNRLYADLIRDILHAHAESVRPGGFTNERLTYCDADSRGERGSGVTGWNELNGILMAMEIPGIYLRTDSPESYVFDAVEVKRSGNTMQISNPTAFTATVSVLAESASQAAKPLGVTAFVNWPKVTLKPGESKRITIAQDGTIE